MWTIYSVLSTLQLNFVKKKKTIKISKIQTKRWSFTCIGQSRAFNLRLITVSCLNVSPTRMGTRSCSFPCILRFYKSITAQNSAKKWKLVYSDIFGVRLNLKNWNPPGMSSNITTSVIFTSSSYFWKIELQLTVRNEYIRWCSRRRKIYIKWIMTFDLEWLEKYVLHQFSL